MIWARRPPTSDRPDAAYLDYLEVHPEECDDLLDTLLINVTEFFRDPPAWEHLADQRGARPEPSDGDGQVRGAIVLTERQLTGGSRSHQQVPTS